MASHPDKLLRHEKAVADKAVAPLRPVLRALLALLSALWPGGKASTDEKQFALRRIELALPGLVASASSIERLIEAGAAEALLLGMASTTFNAPSASKTLPGDLKREATRLGIAMTEQVAKGRTLLRQAQTLSDAQTALSVADPSSRVKAAATYVVNRAANVGIERVAKANPDTVLIFHAERDACTRCLSYQGAVAKHGKYSPVRAFTDGLGIIEGPAVHPHCRCTQEVVHVSAVSSVSTALMREGMRSIARGFSLPSESNAERLRATRRLLAGNPNLPKSVLEYARQAVKRGQYSRGRDVPDVRS